MYKYVINPQVNKALFYKQCERLEKKMSGIVKKRLLEDVDGALIQIYEHPREKSMYTTMSNWMSYIFGQNSI